jgi:hypothetical protein
MQRKVGGFGKIQRSFQDRLVGKNFDVPPPISSNPIQPAARICKKYIEVFIRHLIKLISDTPIPITRRIKEYV